MIKMNEEEMITTYKEFEEAIKNGERKLVKGMGRLQAYEGLEYIKELLENDKYYCEELEDSFVAISSYIDNKEKENKRLKEVIVKVREYTKKEIEFNERQIEAYKTCINTNVYGEFFKETKENMEKCITLSIGICWEMKELLQILDKVGDIDEKKN